MLFFVFAFFECILQKFQGIDNAQAAHLAKCPPKHPDRAIFRDVEQWMVIEMPKFIKDVGPETDGSIAMETVDEMELEEEEQTQRRTGTKRKNTGANSTSDSESIANSINDSSGSIPGSSGSQASLDGSSHGAALPAAALPAAALPGSLHVPGSSTLMTCDRFQF
jgi:hypothetical protein